MDYYAIEGSATIVRQLHKRYPELADKVKVGDFTNDQPFLNDFDIVIDRASLTHNTTQQKQSDRHYKLPTIHLRLGVFL